MSPSWAVSLGAQLSLPRWAALDCFARICCPVRERISAMTRGENTDAAVLKDDVAGPVTRIPVS